MTWLLIFPYNVLQIWMWLVRIQFKSINLNELKGINHPFQKRKLMRWSLTLKRYQYWIKNLLKCSSEIIEGLITNKDDKTYTVTDVYETITLDGCQKKTPNEVLECYKFSKYVLDPNRARFNKFINIFAFVIRFMKRLQPRTLQKTSYRGVSSDEDISASENCFFKKPVS